jgi:amidase
MRLIQRLLVVDWSSVAVGVVIAYSIAPLASLVKSGWKCVATRFERLFCFSSIKARKVEELEKLITEAEHFIMQDSPSIDTVNALSRLSIAELRVELRARRLTATTLLRVFLLNTIDAHRRGNCVVWLMLKDAIQNAAVADQIYDQLDPNVHTLPLLGIPISIKENIGYSGTDCTMGLIHKAFHPVTEDASSVVALRVAGANVFVKTNVPALLMSYECQNALFGVATNPFDARRTCGGSSGGEGCLIALRGSVAGVGTDVGGSIRIPAAFCGLVGLKPTFLRVSSRGNRPVRGDESIPSVTGPMGRCAADVIEMFRSLVNSTAVVDGVVNRVPFREDVFQNFLHKKVLRVGYYVSDGLMETHPECMRVVENTVTALRAEGHHVELVKPPMVLQAMSVFYQLVGADGTRKMRYNLGSDEAFGVIQPLLRLASLPAILRSVAISLVSRVTGPEFAQILTDAVEKRVDEFNDLLVLRNQVRHAFAEMMADSQLDVVVAPGFYIPPPLAGSTTAISYGMFCTGYYNVLDLPVVSLPAGRVESSAPWILSSTANGMSRQIHRVHNLGAGEGLIGLPLGVQIIAPKFMDEVALAVSARIEHMVQV